MVRSSAPETRGTPQWRQRTAVAEFSRSQDGQFMAEHSVRGHQKRDYPVALAQSQEDSQDLGPAKTDLRFLKQGCRHTRVPCVKRFSSSRLRASIKDANSSL